MQPLVLRHATSADSSALRDLAGLESTRLPSGPFLVAEVGGEMQAALALVDGMVLADPFRPTAHLAELLRSHASAQAAAERRDRQVSGRRRRRLPRPAFGH